MNNNNGDGGSKSSSLLFPISERAQILLDKLKRFMDEEVFPNGLNIFNNTHNFLQGTTTSTLSISFFPKTKDFNSISKEIFDI